MPSVLHLRIDSPGFNSSPIEQAFRDLGFDYSEICWQQERFQSGVDALRLRVVQTAQRLMPDYIFAHIQNPEVFDLEIYKALQKCGTVINYTFDVRDREKTEWMYEIAPHIGYTFFACKEDHDECKARGIKNTSHVHSSCDMAIYFPKENSSSFAFDVCFSGNNYVGTNLDFPLAKERQQMIASLDKKLGASFGVYGLGQKGGLITSERENILYNHSRIAVNFNNFDRQDYTSDRLWKIMASGTFCLTKYFSGIENIFQREVHLDWFTTADEMNTLIDFYLKDDKERTAIAATGSQLVREHHTWKDRVCEMMKVLPVSHKATRYEKSNSTI
jgi:hypothetical protein